jgi:hypothetical protein
MPGTSSVYFPDPALDTNVPEYAIVNYTNAGGDCIDAYLFNDGVNPISYVSAAGTALTLTAPELLTLKVGSCFGGDVDAEQMSYTSGGVCVTVGVLRNPDGTVDKFINLVTGATVVPTGPELATAYFGACRPRLVRRIAKIGGPGAPLISRPDGSSFNSASLPAAFNVTGRVRSITIQNLANGGGQGAANRVDATIGTGLVRSIEGTARAVSWDDEGFGTEQIVVDALGTARTDIIVLIEI